MKKHLSVMGAALLAMLALSVVGVASASAEVLPEFKAASFPVHFTSENATGVTPTLLSASGKTITCQTSKDTGEILAGGKEVTAVVVTYTGCKQGTSNCTTGTHATGEIVTKVVAGKTGYLQKSASPPKAGLELKSTSGAFAEFKCENESVATSVTGCTIGEALPVNKAQTTGELVWEDNAENTGQLWTAFEGGSSCTLSAFGLVKSWLMDREVEHFANAAKEAESVELKA